MNYLISIYIIINLSLLITNFSITKFYLICAIVLFNLIGAIIGILIAFNPNKYHKINFNYIKTEYSKLIINYNKLTTTTINNNENFDNNNKITTNSTSNLNDDLEQYSNSKLDSCLDELVKLFVRDFILTWLDSLIWEKDKFEILAINEFKSLITLMRKCLKKFDYVKLMSKDLINKLNEHFLNIQNATETYKLNYFEENIDKECDYLRNIIDCILLSIYQEKHYFKNNALRSLIREVLLNKVFLPMMNKICDPDYLNQKLIDYLEMQEKNRNKKSKKLYTCATNYDQLIKLLKTSKNLDDLNEYNYQITVELMHATILNDINKRNKQSNQLNNDLSQLQQQLQQQQQQQQQLQQLQQQQPIARNFEKYMNQLRDAKQLCLKRIKLFTNNIVNMESIDDNNQLSIEREIIDFHNILNSVSGRNYFLKHLEIDGSDALLRFWNDVYKLKRLKNGSLQQYEFANRIYENFILKYDSPVRDEIGKKCCKEMQLFLIGNNSQNVFFIAQNHIAQVLERDHYPKFILTDLYKTFVNEFNEENENEAEKRTSERVEIELKETRGSISSNDSNNKANELSSSQSHLKKRIESMKSKLKIKLTALNAIRTSESIIEDSKVIEKLENEVKELQQRIGILEYHNEKTEIWCENIGNWKTNILSVDISLSDYGDTDPVPHFVIQVKLYDEQMEANNANNNDFGISNNEGWIIVRTLKQFQALHQHLIQMSPELSEKFKKIPTINRNLITKTFDQNKIQQIKLVLDEYLQFITNDEILANSENLYTFLCQSPDYIKGNKMKIDNNNRNSVVGSNTDLSTTNNPPASDKFSMSSLFDGYRTKEKDELADLFIDPDARFDNNDDSIAVPLYNLIEEIFELKGSKWFRKSLIAFVQFTYGGTINRKIRESIYWMLSEEMLVFYFKQLKNLFWIFNTNTNKEELVSFNNSIYVKNDQERLFTRNLAKKKLIENIPDGLSRVIGDKNSKIGVIKLFESFQDKNLNKHLFYSILELFIRELCPNVFK